MNRRELLRAFAAVAGCTICGRANAQVEPEGCMLSASEAATFGQEVTLLNSSGVALIDQVMPHERNILVQAFGYSPSFSFYDDADGPNAFATSGIIGGYSPHGSVCFGRRLIGAEMGQTWWGAAIAGIAAHEWAHIAQFNRGLSGAVWRKELHADFLAGWYLGMKQRAGTHVVIDGLGASLFGKGSFDFNHPDWHGTPQQRVSAMAVGYQSALPGLALDLNQAFARGRNHVGL